MRSRGWCNSRQFIYNLWPKSTHESYVVVVVSDSPSVFILLKSFCGIQCGERTENPTLQGVGVEVCCCCCCSVFASTNFIWIVFLVSGAQASPKFHSDHRVLVLEPRHPSDWRMSILKIDWNQCIRYSNWSYNKKIQKYKCIQNLNANATKS